MRPTTHIETPNVTNQPTIDFVNKVNVILSELGGIVLDTYKLYQNGVFHTIYKIAISKHYVITLECFDDEGTFMYNDPQHYETLKVVKYDTHFRPIKSHIVPFKDVNSVKNMINIMELSK